MKIRQLLPYLLVGIVFGIVAAKSEIISWYRIQEMFRFQAFHMYGIIGSAVIVAALSVRIIKSRGVHTRTGDPIVIPPKAMSGLNTRYWLGGTLFGLGWALTGACPGPMFALAGTGMTVILVAVAAALAGTFAYGVLRPHLPH